MHKSPFFGHSVEFVQHREYSTGDDIRHPDWKVWSKTDRYYIKQFEAETNLRSHLVVDVSESMHYGHGPLNKYEYACADGAGILVLVERTVPIVHRLANVDDKVRAEVGLGLELLDVVAVRLGPDFPVGVADVVAGAVLTVLHELDGVPEKGALVHAGDEALDDVAGAQIKARDPCDRGRVQESARVVFLRHGGCFLEISPMRQRGMTSNLA